MPKSKVRKTKTKTVQTAEQVKQEKMVAQAQEELKVVAGKVQAILEETGYAIQPFLSFSESGVTPNVRLAKIPEEKAVAKVETNE